MSKIILIGDGAVGSSYAFALTNKGIATELGIMDANVAKAEGDVIDLCDTLAYSSQKRIFLADYKDTKDADMVVICAGLNQKPGQTRLELLHENISLIKSITRKVVDAGFKGIFLVATNPVDILTYAVYKESGFDKSKVIGTGTVLDTARLRKELSDKFKIDTRNVHAYIMGEHGDSEFALWSNASFGSVKLEDIVKKDPKVAKEQLDEIETKVKNTAYEIINRKGATYYGIAVSMCKITKAILNDTNTILTVSCYLDGEFGQKDVYLGVPAVVNKNGIREIIDMTISKDEKKKLDNCAKVIKENIKIAESF